MKKDVIYFGVAIAFMAVLSTGFQIVKPNEGEGFYLEEKEFYNYTVPSELESNQTNISIPFTGKSYVGFKQALAFKESQGKYDLINSYGYIGKYQFGKSALRAIGITNFTNFISNPELQERAISSLLSINKWELRNEIKNYSGRFINGVKITESGLLAAAHLGGASSVKTYLKSNGKNGFKDGYGTSLLSYIKKFSGYNMSNIKSNRFAKVKV